MMGNYIHHSPVTHSQRKLQGHIMDLSHIPIYDHHAHALFHEHVWRSEALEPYFTEAYDPAILSRFTKDNLYFKRSIRDLAMFYKCEPTVDAVLTTRQTWDYLELCKAMFAEANISHWLVDDGIWVDKLWSVQECAERLQPKVFRVARLETELAKLLPNFDSPDKLLAAFAEHLYNLAPTIAAFKSIIAYRTGLDVTHHHASTLERTFSELKGQANTGILKIVNKPLLDEALWVALEVAAQTNKPIQFHTGYGDPDLNLRLANPLHLRSIFETLSLKHVNIVMLHCYPFVKEAGYLASVYEGAYLDVGLTIPYTSVHGMKTAIHEALHLSPLTKVLFSTDAQRTPEIFYLATKWGRKVLAEVLDETVANSDLTTSEATWAAERILQKNSAELYKVD
jgi:uncharacterized protein